MDFDRIRSFQEVRYIECCKVNPLVAPRCDKTSMVLIVSEYHNLMVSPQSPAGCHKLKHQALLKLCSSPGFSLLRLERTMFCAFLYIEHPMIHIRVECTVLALFPFWFT